jgi:hypothetical protein
MHYHRDIDGIRGFIVIPEIPSSERFLKVGFYPLRR